MAFENISKGEFKANFIDLDDFGVAVVSVESKVISQCNFNDQLTEERKDNTEFIAYCFNLQQRYDISKLEEAVDLLSKIAVKLLYGFEIKQDSDIHKQLEHILKEIKK